MTTTHYTIQFISEGVSYTHKDGWGNEVRFECMDYTDEVIRQAFEDSRIPKIEEAVISCVKTTKLRRVTNPNTEDQRAERTNKAKDQIFKILKDLPLPERKTIIAEFYKNV